MHPDSIVRSIYPGAELREAAAGGMPTLVGHFAVFNQWARIDSAMEGTFMERVSPGAFARTIAADRGNMRVLFQHGRDGNIGDKPLGPIANLEEDGTGARYEVPMLDTAYNRELVPGLKAGLYGSSFRFQVVQDDFQPSAARSASNPDGLPERTILEAKVLEFGPVTFPAYAGASAGVRSLTDSYYAAGLDDEEVSDEQLQRELAARKAVFDGFARRAAEDEARKRPGWCELHQFSHSADDPIWASSDAAWRGIAFNEQVDVARRAEETEQDAAGARRLENYLANLAAEQAEADEAWHRANMA